MTVFIEDDAPVIVQGMTGHQGMTHTARMLKAGTNIVGGVNPRKAGTTVPFTMEDGTVRDIPVFATCQEAKAATGAVASVVFVPPKFARRGRRSRRGRIRRRCRHHRRHSRRGQRLFRGTRPAQWRAHRWPELPGPDDPRLIQRIAWRQSGHHPRRHCVARPIGARVQVRYVDLPAYGRALRHRVHRMPWRRWRPDCRHHIAGGIGRVRGRSGHQSRHDDRRNRRQCRTGRRAMGA